MNNINGYIILIIGFGFLFTARGLEQRAKYEEMDKKKRIRTERLAFDLRRQAELDLELAKCKIRIPHDGNSDTNTAKVVLTAKASDNDKGDELSYEWSQTSGANVNLKPKPNEKEVFFNAVKGEYTFEVIVKDNYNDIGTETITVKVLPELNNSPDVEIQCPV
ncbi:MAG: hypothetical protein HOK52_09360 [Candidatus Marinimicrobia bacterium]|jgi:hypothetical protein|nr:hypothetical protein [Candidatus Neomarinimicrobiota bacterium]MBT3936071.1 hypothetical protein [Candidatus Neomarinimicrobiota bacterium]MBT3960434.1 hypothetical protein [Candidatus Neomarinimicrobiota bacterium]MBT4383768.1 hypothetical protein [Candidatus Neomarinimicrobiota bacterium]MBT4636206.1 hypothetical protein [Candidatus Neomarinimicrobiota bacterium]